MSKESQRSYQRQVEACRRAEQRAMHLLDFAPYPMVVLKRDGRVNYVNYAFSEMFGWTLDELAGKPIPYVPPNLVEETGLAVKNPNRGKIIRRLETRRLTKDGRVIDVAVRVATLSEGTEDDDAELVILRDLTHELKTPLSVLKASLSFLEKKMKVIPEAVWKPGLERAQRNLNRILDIQHQAEDIMQARPY